MAFDLNSVMSAKKVRPPRLLVIGNEKVGKSTFGSQAPAPIFLPMRGEEGIDALDVPAFPVAQRYQDIMEAIGTLYSSEHKYETFVLDSASAMEPLIWDEACRINGGVDTIEKIGGGYGKGYAECLKQWREILDGLTALRDDRNMTILLIGHARVEKFNDPNAEPYDRYSMAVHKLSAELLKRWADGIIFIQRKITIRKEDAGFNRKAVHAIDVHGGKPFMYTQSMPAHPGGGRGNWGKIPYELPLSWAALFEALAKAEA